MAQPSQFAYVATAQKSTGVSHSLVASFTGPSDVNLIIAKTNRIEIHLITTGDLQPVVEAPVYGRITCLESLRPSGFAQDLLFVCTARYKFALLSYDASKGTIVTEANGDVRDLVGREAKSHMSVVDDACTMIGLHMYEGLFKVIPLPFARAPSGPASEAFNVKFDELNVIDVKMVPGGTGGKPTLAVLHEDSDGFRHVKTYVIDVSDRNLIDGPWNQPTVEAGASFLIPVPAPTPGVLIVGLETITFHDGRQVKTARMPAMYPRAYGKLDADGSRHLLADQAGNLYVVVLVRDADSVTSIVVEKIGETAIASTLSYLDNGFVFVGSAFGDSQLIKLNADTDDSPVTIMESYLSLGPIVDACVVDLDRQGQCQVVTCSGAFKNASLRVVRSGIGVEEQAVIELEGIKNIWSLRKTFESPFHTYLVQSYVSETRVFGIEGEEMEERTFEALVSDVSSVYCGNAVHDTIVQVTPSEVRVLQLHDDNSLTLITAWAPPGGARITVATGNATQIVAALTGGTVVLLEVSKPAGTVVLSKLSETVLPHEVSCISVQPLPSVSDDADDVAVPLAASFAAIGLWKDASVRLVALPTLTELSAVTMKSDAQARSVLLTVLQRTAYLLVGTADGHLLSHKLAAEAGGLTLKDPKKVSLGSQPVMLSQFHSKGVVNVFACCDRPTVVYSGAPGKLLYSNVNLTEVNVMASFHSESFPECLALASGTQLTIGTIDDIQKLHVKTVPLPGEQSRRIVHHKPSRTLVVLTSASVLSASAAGSASDSGGYVEKCFLKLFDDTTFESLHSLELEDAEQALALVSMQFLDDDTEYVIVGSSFVLEDEEEPSKGKLSVYAVVVDGEGSAGFAASRRLVNVNSVMTKGGVLSLANLRGRLVAGINSKVQVYRWDSHHAAGDGSGTKELIAECGRASNIMALLLDTRGDFVLVGDLMMSLCVLKFNAIDSKLEDVAADSSDNHMTAMAILDDAHYLGAEDRYNLFIAQRHVEAMSDEERARLDIVSEFHLGDFVNKFTPGSLVMLPSEAGDDAETTTAPHCSNRQIFVTISGAIGVVFNVSPALFGFLNRLQTSMRQVVRGIGGFSHAEWRSWSNNLRIPSPLVETERSSRGFVDGDLVEAFLELNREEADKVVTLLSTDGEGGPGFGKPGEAITFEFVQRIVEELARSH